MPAQKTPRTTTEAQPNLPAEPNKIPAGIWVLGFISHKSLLAWGLVVLIAADLMLAMSSHWSTVLAVVALWGIHIGMTQGLLATMVADTAPADLRGTASESLT